jgi:CheY-like chemotaxis protein
VSTVLLVEDETQVAAALRDLLEKEGYSVRVAGSIAEGRRELRAGGVDVMLLDWRLPDGEGIDLLKELRKTSDLPVLMVTARVEVIDRVLGLEIGADDYVTKPVEPRELLARIKARLRTRSNVAAQAAAPRTRRRRRARRSGDPRGRPRGSSGAADADGVRLARPLAGAPRPRLHARRAVEPRLGGTSARRRRAPSTRTSCSSGPSSAPISSSRCAASATASAGKPDGLFARP